MGKILVIKDADFSAYPVAQVESISGVARGDISSLVNVLADDTVITTDIAIGTPKSTWQVSVGSGLWRTREIDVRLGFSYNVSVTYTSGSGVWAGILVDASYNIVGLLKLKSSGGAQTLTFSSGVVRGNAAKIIMSTPFNTTTAAVNVVEV